MGKFVFFLKLTKCTKNGPILGKFWLKRYRPKCFYPIKLQDSLTINLCIVWRFQLPSVLYCFHTFWDTKSAVCKDCYWKIEMFSPKETHKCWLNLIPSNTSILSPLLHTLDGTSQVFLAKQLWEDSWKILTRPIRKHPPSITLWSYLGQNNFLYFLKKSFSYVSGNGTF